MAPHAVRTLAHERRTARIARDWATADRLKAAIEAEGWRVVDRGADFALEPAAPPDVEVDGLLLYGSPERVPSRLDSPAHPGVTVVLVGAEAAAAGIAAVGSRVVLAIPGAMAVDSLPEAEVVRLAGDPTTGDLSEAGIRRVTTSWAILVLPDAADVPVTPLIAAIEAAPPDSDVAAAGLIGARTPDLHRFEPVAEGDADVLLAGPIAVRRDDLAAVLPLERRIVSPDRFAQWLTLALRRDTVRPAGAGGPRRAVVIDGAGTAVVERRARAASDDRIAKRDFYRVLDPFAPDPALLSRDR